MASNRVEKESVEALNSIWNILVKHRQKTKRPLVLLKALRERAKDHKNKIQGFLAHQKDCIEREAAINPHKHSQRNTGRV